MNLKQLEALRLRRAKLIEQFEPFYDSFEGTNGVYGTGLWSSLERLGENDLYAIELKIAQLRKAGRWQDDYPDVITWAYRLANT